MTNNPSTKILKDRSHLCIYLYAVKTDPYSYCSEYIYTKCSFEIAVLGPNALHCTKTFREKKLLPFDGLGFSQFMKTESIPEYISEDAFKIQVKILITNPLKNRVLDNCIQTSLKRRRTHDEETKHQTELYKSDMKKLKTEPTDADVWIRASSKTFHVHKIILRCRSTVFENMFLSNDWKDKESGIEIPSFSEEVVQGMIDYIYTGEVQDLKERTLDYYKISEIYELIGLKEMSEIQIMESLTVKNSIEILIAANEYKNTTLKKDLISYINKNKKAVKATEGFKELKDAELLLALYADEN